MNFFNKILKVFSLIFGIILVFNGMGYFLIVIVYDLFQGVHVKNYSFEGILNLFFNIVILTLGLLLLRNFKKRK